MNRFYFYLHPVSSLIPILLGPFYLSVLDRKTEESTDFFSPFSVGRVPFGRDQESRTLPGDVFFLL